MTNHNKNNGSKYERELVHKLQDAGLVAQRVPLSGAMAGYPGDVIVSDTWTLECKYSRTGAGFKTLATWATEHPFYCVGDLTVYSHDLWVALELERVNGSVDLALSLPPIGEIQSTQRFRFIHKALGQGDGAADFVACRMPRRDWIFVAKTSTRTLAQS